MAVNIASAEILKWWKASCLAMSTVNLDRGIHDQAAAKVNLSVVV
jgi:hypothetical protein